MARFTEAVPLPRPVGDALRHDDTLLSLSRRMERSERCLRAVMPVVPPVLRPHLLAGPWDEAGWTLLTRQPAALTKLKHLAPALEGALKQAGLPVATLRIRPLVDRGR